MSHKPVHLPRRDGTWSAEERAVLARMQDAFLEDGLAVDIEQGLSDEGAPWATFYHRGDGSFLGHVTRDRRWYVLICSDMSVERSAVIERLLEPIRTRCRQRAFVAAWSR